MRNLVPQIWSDEIPFIARSAAHTAITTGRYLQHEKQIARSFGCTTGGGGGEAPRHNVKCRFPLGRGPCGHDITANGWVSHLESMLPTDASIRSDSATGIRTNAKQKPRTNLGTRRNRDLGGLGGKGTNGFTPDDRSAHLLNFCTVLLSIRAMPSSKTWFSN